MARPFDVAVVGYGPTGATLAALCLRAGLRVVVIERAAQMYPLPRAVQLDGEVMRVFQTVGIGAALRRAMRVNKGMRFVGPDGAVLLDWPRPGGIGPQGWHASYRFHQPALERLLRRQVTRLGGAVIEGHTVEALEETGGLVNLETRARVGNATRTVQAHYVVGCDGANSTVRGAMGAKLTDLGFAERWLVCDTILRRQMPDLGDRTLQFCDPVYPMTYCRNVGLRRRWEFRLDAEEDAGAVIDSSAVWKRLARWITPEDAELERAVVYTFRSAIADRWRAGRIMIAGDAAHLTPPFMGQGMCAGIRDAANLAWKLAHVVHGGDATLLDTYAGERVAHVRDFIDTAVRLGRLINATDRKSAQALAERNGAMNTPAPRLGDLSLGGRLAVTEMAGTLAPQPVLADGRLLDDAAGYAPVRLCRETAPTRGVATFAGSDHPGVARMLDQLGCDAALLRPDRYVAATASGPGAAEKLPRWPFSP